MVMSQWPGICHNQLTKKADQERQNYYTPPWDLRTGSDCRVIEWHKLDASKRTYYRLIQCHGVITTAMEMTKAKGYGAAKSADNCMRSTVRA